MFFINSKIFGDLKLTSFITLNNENPNNADHMATKGPINKNTLILKILKLSSETFNNMNIKNKDANPPK